MTWKVDLEEDVFVDDGKICEICEMDENFDLHGVIDQENIVCKNVNLHILLEEIRSDEFMEGKEFNDLMNEEENSDLVCEEKNNCC